MKKGLLRSTAMTVAAVAGFSSMAHAGMLTTMEQMMAASGAPDGAFTYDSVISDTDSGFEITGVRMEPEPGEGVVTIDRLILDAMDMASVQAGGPPSFMDLTAEGVTVPAETLDPDAREVFPDGMTFDIGIDFEMDAGTNSLLLNEFAFSMPDYGDINVSADVTGLTMEAIAGAMFMGPEALAEASISSASIMLNDEGGLGTLLSAIAAEEGMDVDSFVTQGLLPQMDMMGGMFASDPIGAALVDSITGFVADYNNPQGPLTITASPDSPVGLMSLMELADPSALPSMLGLSSSYEGGDGSAAATPSEEEDGGTLFGQDSQTDEGDSVEQSPAEAAPAGDGAFATLMALAEASGMPEGALTYDQVLSDTPDSFILSNVHFAPSNDPDEFIDIEMLSVIKIDMESITNGAPPMALQLAAQGIVLPTDEMDDDIRQMLGVDVVTANFFLDYVLDPATGDFDVNGMTLEIPELGSLTFNLAMAQVDPAAIMGMAMMGPEAMSDALLESAALSFTDEGFMQNFVAFIAAEEGISEQEVLDEMFGGLESVRPMFADDPIATSALDAVGEYLEDYQSPDGALGIVLNPPAPISIAEINAAADPSQLPAMLGLVIGY